VLGLKRSGRLLDAFGRVAIATASNEGQI